MTEFRIYVSYKLPDIYDVEAEDEDEAIGIVSDQLAEIVDLDYVEFEIEELDESQEEEDSHARVYRLKGED